MIKLYNLADWHLWAEGKGLPFPSGKVQRVRLDVNCTEPTEFRAEVEWSETSIFLGVVHGLDTIEFDCAGDCVIYATTDGEVRWYSSAYEVVWAENPEAESFVKPMQRRHRNPELERLMQVMRQNQNALLEHQARELARIEQQYAERTRAAAAAQREVAPEPPKSGEAKAPDADTVASDGPQ